MLTAFDWVRRSVSGAELLATLKLLQENPSLGASDKQGPPHSALGGPCPRCWTYAPANPEESGYCAFCREVAVQTPGFKHYAYSAVVIWGYVTRLPLHLEARSGFYQEHLLGAYLHDEKHFLLVMPRNAIKPWIQELIFYHGADLQGMIQLLPNVGTGIPDGMGDLINRAVHHESRFPLDRLRVRFYPAPYHVRKPQLREKQGLLTFDVADFMSLLEMASVFRSVLSPATQQILYGLLNLEDAKEEGFYWGRFLGMLAPQEKDMLTAWKIRQWPRQRVKLLYELTKYVDFSPTH